MKREGNHPNIDLLRKLSEAYINAEATPAQEKMLKKIVASVRDLSTLPADLQADIRLVRMLTSSPETPPVPQHFNQELILQIDALAEAEHKTTIYKMRKRLRAAIVACMATAAAVLLLLLVGRKTPMENSFRNVNTLAENIVSTTQTTTNNTAKTTVGTMQLQINSTPTHSKRIAKTEKHESVCTTKSAEAEEILILTENYCPSEKRNDSTMEMPTVAYSENNVVRTSSTLCEIPEAMIMLEEAFCMIAETGRTIYGDTEKTAIVAISNNSKK